MSNFWVFNKKNFFTPSLIFFVFACTVYTFTQPLRPTSSNFQFIFLVCFTILSVSFFLSNYYFLQKAFNDKNKLYLLMNVVFIGVFTFFYIKAIKSLSEVSYPVEFLKDYLFINILFIIQLVINQKLSYLKTNLYLFYISIFIAVLFILRPDFLNNISRESIQLYQLTGLIIMICEIFRVLRFGDLLAEIIDLENK